MSKDNTDEVVNSDMEEDLDDEEKHDMKDNSLNAESSDNHMQVDNVPKPAAMVTLCPSGTIQFFRTNNPECPTIEGAVFKATWDGNALGLDSQESSGLRANLKGSGDNSEACDAAITIARSSPSSTINYGDIGSGGTPGGGGPPTRTNPPRPTLTFADCGGLEKQIEFLRTAVVKPLVDPNGNQFIKRFGSEPPKGILFYGPPGTGKTRLAQAMATELSRAFGKNVHFIYRKGIDVASKYFGQSSGNLRSVFDEAKASQPCVLFFDELDGLAPTRDKPFVHQANITIVTTMLGLLDELPRGKVFVIAATNRLDVIDPALRRPGRFDKYLEFLPPTEDGRFQILSIHTKTWKVKPDGNLLQNLSGNTVGFSGADLSKLCLDAFDQAVNRCLAANNGTDAHYLDTQKLNNLNVTENDWMSALKKIKPSNSSVFGSVLYSPPHNDFGVTHMAPLIQEDVAKINGLLHDILPANGKNHSSIRSLYIWSETELSVKSVSIDDFIVPEVLRSGELKTFPVYALNTEIMSNEKIHELSAKINSIFSQALDAPKSVLYIQDVNEVWGLINSSRVSLAVNLKGQLERLRGSSVILLASGSTSVTSLAAAHNPFGEMFSGPGPNKNYEISRPSRAARFEFFSPLFMTILWDSGLHVPWPPKEAESLDFACETALDATEQKCIGSILRLFEMIFTAHSRNPNVEDKDAVLENIWRSIGLYKIQTPPS